MASTIRPDFKHRPRRPWYRASGTSQKTQRSGEIPCPFRKFHPVRIRIVSQNRRIIESDVCDPARARRFAPEPNAPLVCCYAPWGSLLARKFSLLWRLGNSVRNQLNLLPKAGAPQSSRARNRRNSLYFPSYQGSDKRRGVCCRLLAQPH